MKLYIGNLPFTAGDDELKELFSAYGTPTTTVVVMDSQSGRSRGFGFVEFDDATQAKAAIAGVNGREFGGRSLVVNEARSQGGGSDRRGGFGGDRGGYGGGRPRY